MRKASCLAHLVEPALADRHEERLAQGELMRLFHGGHRLLQLADDGLILDDALQFHGCLTPRGEGTVPAFQDCCDENDPKVTSTNETGTQFTVAHYRGVVTPLDLMLSRTAFRDPYDKACVERMFRTLREELISPNEFGSYGQVLAAILAGIGTSRLVARMLAGLRHAPLRHHLGPSNTRQQPGRQARRGSRRPSKMIRMKSEMITFHSGGWSVSLLIAQ